MRAVVTALEDLCRYRSDHGGNAIADYSLRGDHDVKQRTASAIPQQQQQDESRGKAQAAHSPDELASNAIGQVAKHDLARDAGKADAA